MKFIFIFLISTITFKTLHSQEKLTISKIDSLIQLKTKTEMIKKMYDNSSARFLLDEKTKELIWALIYYPKAKAITLYFWHQQLIKAKVQTYSAINKATDGGIYYFDQGINIFKRETNIEPQSISEILKISSEYLEKAKQ
ncbi:MAG TPA: hypothetical protein VIZ28_19410 [Chitinophagaceae bacterium]